MTSERLARLAPPGELMEPLPVAVRRGILALVIFFHVGGGWALTQVEPVRLIVGDVAPMEVRMVSDPAAPDSQPDEPTPVEVPPPDLAAAIEPPPPEPPPPEIPLPQLTTVLEPPPPDLPAPEFPVEARPPDPPPPPPEPPPPESPKPLPKPVQRPAQAPARAPVQAPQQAAPAAPAAAAPRTVSVSQLGWLVSPNPVYPTRSRRAGEQGTAIVRILVDVAGRPAQVSLQTSSGHPELDASAVSAVRAAQFRPYVEGGLAQAVWVLVPIKFVLQ